MQTPPLPRSLFRFRLIHQSLAQRRGGQLFLGLAFGLTALTADGLTAQWVQASSGPSSTSIAATAATAPPQLKELLAKIDAAASQRDLKAVLQFYSESFTQSDGLTRQTLEQTLTEFWRNYKTLTYRTQLQSWQPAGNNGFVAETMTTITGTQQLEGRELSLKATLSSRQRFENQKITNQEILSERSQVTSGKTPPVIDLNLPEQVAVGQEYSFDVIVKQPLGDSLLLGAALEEPINAKTYLQKAPLKLELLPAGGLFKIGRAPNQPMSEWISAVLIQEAGMTVVSQRLKVVNRISFSRPSQQSTLQFARQSLLE